MIGVLKSFQGVEHRIEPVCTIDGVAYYNDSKATNTDSAIKALETFAGHIVLLAGGDDKMTDLTDFMQLVVERADELILLGNAAARFKKAALQQDFAVEHIHEAGYSMEKAVAMAHELARPPQVVLLSPACASFDMFSGYEERGRKFKELVRQFCV
jgi:UDP-N-acetylmuramoylalanine--D-glutamate ligase